MSNQYDSMIMTGRPTCYVYKVNKINKLSVKSLYLRDSHWEFSAISKMLVFRDEIFDWIAQGWSLKK